MFPHMLHKSPTALGKALSDIVIYYMRVKSGNMAEEINCLPLMDVNRNGYRN